MGTERDKIDDVLVLLRELLLKLNIILKKIESLEERFPAANMGFHELRMAIEMATALSTPLVNALDFARRAWKVLSKMARVDPITRVIIQVLSTCSEMSVSEVYRSVKEIRGKASRRIISERLKKLVESGIVVNKGSEQRPRYVLRECIEERSGINGKT